MLIHLLEEKEFSIYTTTHFQKRSQQRFAKTEHLSLSVLNLLIRVMDETKETLRQRFGDNG